MSESPKTAKLKTPPARAGQPRSQQLPEPAAAPGLAAPVTATAETRRQRAAGGEARQHLLLTALRLFSEKGFAKTSTRTIAKEAGVNIASISYYFGDKAGLYRAIFNEPLGNPK